MIRGPCGSNNPSWTKYVEVGTGVSILVGVTWSTVKNLDGFQTELPIGFFQERQVSAMTLFETEVAI